MGILDYFQNEEFLWWLEEILVKYIFAVFKALHNSMYSKECLNPVLAFLLVFNSRDLIVYCQ